VLVAQLAARHFTREHRLQLKEILARMSAALAADNQTQLEVECTRFHRALAEIAGNRRLARLVTAVGEEIQRFRSLNVHQSTRTKAVVREHRQIFAALVAHDEARAARLMADHVAKSLAHARQFM